MSIDRLAARLSACRDVIEQVVLDLPSLPPRVNRAPLVALLERALGLAAQAAGCSADDPDHLALTSAASTALVGAASVLQLAASRQDAAPLLDRLRSAQRALEVYRREALEAMDASRPPRPGAPPARLRASVGVPALHRLDRRPLAPRARFTAAAGDDHGDAEHEGRRVRSEEPSAVLLLDQLRRLAQDCFAELGELGNLRAPSEEVPWSPELARFEARLLADLDAVAALGQRVIFDGEPALQLDVLDELLAFADDELCPDPGRAFARAFILGCVEGDDAARAAVLALRQSDPLTHDAQRSALALASSPCLAPALEGLVLDRDPALATLALDVLRARREGDTALAAVLLAHPEPRARRSAALFLGASREGNSAVALLLAALDVELDGTAFGGAVESLIRLGRRAGLTAARARLQGDVDVGEGSPANGPGHVVLLRVLALAGGPGDAALLLRAFAAAPSEAITDLLGWHGHPGSVDPLSRALTEACAGPDGGERPRALAEAIALAIHRITGAEVTPTAEGARAFAAWWSEHRDQLGSEAERRIDGGRPARYRRGHRYTLQGSLDELAASGSAPTREALALEIAAASSGAARLDVDGWVARQLADIAAAREMLAAARPTFQPGDWPEHRLV